MKRTEVIELLRERLDLGPQLTGDEDLVNLPWDSMTAIFFMSLADECFGVQVDGDQLVRCKTVEHLVELLGTGVSV